METSATLPSNLDLVEDLSPPTPTMSSRQKVPIEDPSQVLGDDEPVSGNGEGDEIMEEPEEQEDGYSELFSRALLPPLSSLPSAGHPD